MLGERPSGRHRHDRYTGRALVVDDPTVAMAHVRARRRDHHVGHQPVVEHVARARRRVGHRQRRTRVTRRGHRPRARDPGDHRRPHGVPAVAHRHASSPSTRSGPPSSSASRAVSRTMPPFPSAPALVVLHTVRITGRVPTRDAARAHGPHDRRRSTPSSRRRRRRLVLSPRRPRPGLVAHADGRHRHSPLLAHERAAAGRDTEILAGVRRSHGAQRVVQEPVHRMATARSSDLVHRPPRLRPTHRSTPSPVDWATHSPGSARTPRDSPGRSNDCRQATSTPSPRR